MGCSAARVGRRVTEEVGGHVAPAREPGVVQRLALGTKNIEEALVRVTGDPYCSPVTFRGISRNLRSAKVTDNSKHLP